MHFKFFGFIDFGIKKLDFIFFFIILRFKLEFFVLLDKNKSLLFKNVFKQLIGKNLTIIVNKINSKGRSKNNNLKQKFFSLINSDEFLMILQKICLILKE